MTGASAATASQKPHQHERGRRRCRDQDERTGLGRPHPGAAGLEEQLVAHRAAVPVRARRTSCRPAAAGTAAGSSGRPVPGVADRRRRSSGSRRDVPLRLRQHHLLADRLGVVDGRAGSEELLGVLDALRRAGPARRPAALLRATCSWPAASSAVGDRPGAPRRPAEDHDRDEHGRRRAGRARPGASGAGSARRASSLIASPRAEACSSARSSSRKNVSRSARTGDQLGEPEPALGEGAGDLLGRPAAVDRQDRAGPVASTREARRAEQVRAGGVGVGDDRRGTTCSPPPAGRRRVPEASIRPLPMIVAECRPAAPRPGCGS